MILKIGDPDIDLQGQIRHQTNKLFILTVKH